MQPSAHKEELKTPSNLLPSLRAIEFICPLCRRDLEVGEDGYRCLNCGKSYLLHDGIPDFRVFPDPFLSYQEDYERTDIVIAALEKFNLKELLEHYWSYSDITPAALRPKFVRSAVLGEDKARRTLEILGDEDVRSAKRVLEIGAGTGNFLALAAPHYKQVIGIDIAMRWLHVSRRRFMDAGMPIPPLVCCCAEFLPFADDAFDLIVASSTLEFVEDQAKVLSECARTLAKDGILYVNSANRYSIGRDPYSYLWAVGFLPRRWQARYVKTRSGAHYESIKTLSYGELTRSLKSDFSLKKVALPDVSASMLKEFSFGTRLQIKTYQLLKKLPLFTVIFKRVGPGWDMIMQKKSAQ